MKSIISLLYFLTFISTKAQDSHVYVTSHYKIDGSQSVIYSKISFMMITSNNYATLYVKNRDIDKWLIEDYPLELIESGTKDGLYFEKYNISKGSSTFVESTKKYETRGYYFFFDEKGGAIKSIVEVLIYSKDNIVTKRYYP